MGDYVDGAASLEALAAALVHAASERGVTVATAESCTAGLVASTIAEVSGASDVLRGGAVTYVDEIKHKVLGVSLDTLAHYTAVSHQTAFEMAEGARSVFGSDLAVSLTGYAGPGGGTDDDPVGTVYIGLAAPQGTAVERFAFAGDRNDVRRQACARALRLLQKACVEIA